MIVPSAGRISGTLRVPGDKSISHRALIVGTIAKGKQLVEGIPRSQDVRSTITCLRSLGAFIEEMPDGRYLVLSKELVGGATLDAGNSGTTARLLAGLLAGQPLTSTIDGDESLRRRPMKRVIEPLTLMGAEIKTPFGDRLPITVKGGHLRGITYRLPVASAQVKSAILIAGLAAEGETVVEEPIATRDHTERLLAAMSASVTRQDGRIAVRGGSRLRSIHVRVPGDFSSAAFFMAAAICLPDSELYLPAVGANPGRTGMLRALQEMGARIEIVNKDRYLEEPVADLIVRSSSLHGVTVEGTSIPTMIDELAVLAVIATQADGETVVKNAGELRHKESDRIASIVDNLVLLGADIEARSDGFAVRGPTPLKGTSVHSRGDHRIAMAMAVAGLLAEGETKISGSEAIDISYPRFFEDLWTVVR